MQPENTLLRKDLLINLGVLVLAMASLYVALKVWGPDEMRAWIESAGVWAPLALVAAKTSTIVFAPLSGGFLYPLGGGLFGFWKALGLLVLGDALGGSIAFWISRRFGRGTVEKFLGNESGLLTHILSTMGTVRGFLITRLLLVTAQDIIAYSAGLTKLPFLWFLVIHVGVSLIPTVILTALGSALLVSPSAGTLGLIFAGMSGVGVISTLAFAWYTGKDFFAKQNEQNPA